MLHRTCLRNDGNSLAVGGAGPIVEPPGLFCARLEPAVHEVRDHNQPGAALARLAVDRHDVVRILLHKLTDFESASREAGGTVNVGSTLVDPCQCNSTFDTTRFGKQNYLMTK